MDQDLIRERCEAMTDRELVTELTLRRDDNGPQFRELALRQLEQRGTRLDEYIDRVRVRADDEERTVTLAAALSLLGDGELYQTLSFASCLDDVLLVQRERAQWTCHFYAGDNYRGSFFRPGSEAVADVLRPILLLEPFEMEGEELLQLDDWVAFVDSEAVDYVESVARDLASAGIPHTVKTPLFVSGTESELYAILVPQEHLDEAYDVFDEVEETVDDLYRQAEERGRRGDLNAELEIYDLLVASDPENHAVFYNRGHILLELRRYEEAARALIAAVSLGMQEVDRSLELQQRGTAGLGGLAGLFALLLPRPAPAHQATAAYPDFIDDSRMLLEQLLVRLPRDVGVLHCLASIARLRNERAVAASHYRRILEIDSDDQVAYFNLGYLHSEQGGDADSTAP